MPGRGPFTAFLAAREADGRDPSGEKTSVEIFYGSITQTKGPMAWDRPLAWGFRGECQNGGDVERVAGRSACEADLRPLTRCLGYRPVFQAFIVGQAAGIAPFPGRSAPGREGDGGADEQAAGSEAPSDGLAEPEVGDEGADGQRVASKRSGGSRRWARGGGRRGERTAEEDKDAAGRHHLRRRAERREDRRGGQGLRPVLASRPGAGLAGAWTRISAVADGPDRSARAAARRSAGARRRERPRSRRRGGCRLGVPRGERGRSSGG